jgi:hypothetical protein
VFGYSHRSEGEGKGKGWLRQATDSRVTSLEFLEITLMADLTVSELADGRDRQKTLALMEIAEALKLIQVQLNDIRLEVKEIAATAGQVFGKQ